jgi:hypothetical protein
MHIPFVLQSRGVGCFSHSNLHETHLTCLLGTYSCYSFNGVFFFLFMVEWLGIGRLRCAFDVCLKTKRNFK